MQTEETHSSTIINLPPTSQEFGFWDPLFYCFSLEVGTILLFLT